MQIAKNPGSMLEPKFAIEMIEQIISAVAEKLSAILTLYSFRLNRNMEEINNTRILTTPISIT